MFEFARKLMLSRKLKMERGELELLDQEVLIIPKNLLRRIIEVYAEQPGLERDIYRIMKESVREFSAEIDSDHSFTPRELLDTLLKLTELNGYGNIEVVNYNPEDKMVSFMIKNLPSERMRDQYSFKADTYWAGMLAGGVSYIFQADIDAVETQCVVEGENQCEFLAAPPDVLREKHPDLYEEKV